MCEFYSWVDTVDFVHKGLEVRVGACPDNENVVDVSVPHVNMLGGLGLEFRFQCTHKYVGV